MSGPFIAQLTVVSSLSDIPIKEFAEDLAGMMLQNLLDEEGDGPRLRRPAADGGNNGPVACVALPLRGHPFYTEGKGQFIKGSVV